MAVAGAVLTAASPSSAGSAFVFVASVAAAVRSDLRRAFRIAFAGAFALAVAELAYDGSALGTLAYALGFAATMLAASNSRNGALRTEQAELLLAQSQRSHEEQLRAAKLEESTRIAREIHDVLAHTLAGLTIQLEATASLLEHGAERDTVLARVRRAHELAREGLAETRRAVGALRGGPAPGQLPLADRLDALAAAGRASGGAALELTVEGDPGRLSPAVCDAILRVAQEAITNTQKHAPGAVAEVRARRRREDDQRRGPAARRRPASAGRARRLLAGVERRRVRHRRDARTRRGAGRDAVGGGDPRRLAGRAACCLPSACGSRSL